jgi:hypothetical protein
LAGPCFRAAPPRCTGALRQHPFHSPRSGRRRGSCKRRRAAAVGLGPVKRLTAGRHSPSCGACAICRALFPLPFKGSAAKPTPHPCARLHVCPPSGTSTSFFSCCATATRRALLSPPPSEDSAAKTSPPCPPSRVHTFTPASPSGVSAFFFSCCASSHEVRSPKWVRKDTTTRWPGTPCGKGREGVVGRGEGGRG